MKKFLAVFLAVVMLVSTGAACIFTSNAANKTTQALNIDSGYVQFDLPNKVSIDGGYWVEFDLWLINDNSKIQFWADYASSRPTVAKTYVGVDSSCKETYGQNDFKPFDWGETGATSDNFHHVRIEFAVGGSDNIWIDGVEVYHSGRTCNEYWAAGAGHDGDTQILNADNVMIDNVQYKGNELLDFENGSAGYLDGQGKIVTAYTEVQTGPEMSNGLLLDTGYGYKSDISSPGKGETWEFDMWLLSDDAELQIWADGASTRIHVAKTFVGAERGGGASAYPANNYVPYEWGETGITSDNHHHIKIELGVNGSDNIWIDGDEIFHSGQTCNSYFGGCFILSTGGKGVVIDNFSLTNMETLDFENGAGWMSDLGSITEVIVDANGGEVTCPHPSTEVRREKDPTCQETGLDGVYCTSCGVRLDEKVVPTVDHNWPSRNNLSDRKEATETEDGYEAWSCSYGCGTTVKNSIPATGKYTGTLYHYYDFEDAIATQKVLKFFDSDGNYYYEVANGVGTIPVGDEWTYNQNSEGLVNPYDFSVSMDITINGLFDTSDTKNHGHKIDFYYGGDNGMAYEIGYNFDRGVLYMNRLDFEFHVSYVVAEKEIDLGEGTHNIALRVHAKPEEKLTEEEADAMLDGTNWLAVEIDGVEVLRVDEWWTTLNMGTEKDHIIQHAFGVNATIDNYAVGSSDFRWVKEPVKGDADGDGKVTLRDMRDMKAYIAGFYTDEDVDITAIDMNGDGKITSVDVMMLTEYLIG